MAVTIITHWTLKSCVNICMWFRFINSSINWHKRTRTNMLSMRTISTSLSRWHLHLSSRKKDYRERGSTERIPYQMEHRDDCRFHSSRTKGGYTRKWIQKHTEGLSKTCGSDRRNVSPAYQCVAKIMSSFYWCLFPPFFLLSAHPSRSIFRKDPDACFHSKHSEEASPCNNTTVNTKDRRPISSFNNYGVSFCHIFPSLKASSPLKRNVWKKKLYLRCYLHTVW